MSSKLNLIAECQRIRAELDRVYAAQSGTLPKNAQAKFQLALDLLGQADVALADISENVRDLTAIEFNSQALLRASEAWASVPDGPVKGTPLEMLFKQSSQALKYLHRGRIDAISSYKFSSDELAFARELGQDFNGYEPIWADWRFNVTAKDRDARHYLWINERGEKQKTADGRDVVAPNRFLKRFAKLLQRWGLYSAPSIDEPQMCKAFGRKKITEPEAWAPIKNGWEGFEKENFLTTAQCRVLLGDPLNPALFQFVLGGWFEAYVQYLFSDMLQRLELPHEIVTRLKYSTVRETKGRSEGELDVLISTDDKLVVVECKSGKFTIEDARRTLERKTVIEDALLDAQATSMKLDFLLVHAPRSESPDARQLVEGAGIHVLGPVEVLSFAKNHFQGRRR